MNDRFKQLLSRKFVLALWVVLQTGWLCWAGFLHEGVYSAVVIAVVGGYLTSNVVQKATSKPGDA